MKLDFCDLTSQHGILYTHIYIYWITTLRLVAWHWCGTAKQWDLNVRLSFFSQRTALYDLNTLWSCQRNERLDGSSETLERSVGGIDFKHSQSRQWPTWKSAARRWRETERKGEDGEGQRWIVGEMTDRGLKNKRASEEEDEGAKRAQERERERGGGLCSPSASSCAFNTKIFK